MTQQKTN